MKSSWIFLIPTLCTTVYTYDIPEVIGSLNLSGNSYRCENGVKPSIACTDPSLSNHKCSCTCTNGIMFEQPLSLSSQPSGSTDSSLVDCHAGKNECLLREQKLVDELKAKQEEHIQREQELMDELDAKEKEQAQREQDLSARLSQCQGKTFRYQGCYTDGAKRVLADSLVRDPAMTVEKCATICQDFTHYGLQNGYACLCGNEFKQTTEKVEEKECSTKCAGNANQKCGGPGKNSLYSKTF